MTMTLQEALDLWENGHTQLDTARLPHHVQERLKTSAAHAKNAAARVDPAEVNRAMPLLGMASTTSTSGKRVMWLQKAAQVLSDTYGPHAACKSGCTHCCHIPVKITQAEAVYIGRQIGRRPRPAEHLGAEPAFQGYESPCPFLANGGCTIYDHRPMICRAHMNLDQDELLCKLLPGTAVPVPYLDTRLLTLAAMDILGQGQPIGDLRQWFPAATSA